MGRVEVDHIKRLITLTSDNIKRLSLYNRKKIIVGEGPLAKIKYGSIVSLNNTNLNIGPKYWEIFLSKSLKERCNLQNINYDSGQNFHAFEDYERPLNFGGLYKPCLSINKNLVWLGPWYSVKQIWHALSSKNCSWICSCIDIRSVSQFFLISGTRPW